MAYQEYRADQSPTTASLSPGGVMPPDSTSYGDADGSYNAAITLPSAIGRRNEIFTIRHNATLDAVLQGTNKTPATALTLSAANPVTRWISDGATWRAVEDSKAGGNVLAVVTNVLPIAILPVSDLFEISMPANTDVRIRSLVNRQVYLTSEGEYPGGSFTTSTAAIVNLTPTFVPADNNVHVNGELNVLRIQDISSGRLFVVTVWRLGAIAGNWSGWVEEIGVSVSGIIPAPQDFFRSANALPDGTNDLTKPIYHSGFVGVGLTANPICPLEFGDPVRNDVIRVWDGGVTNDHQFYGFGIGGETFRYQANNLAASHVFYAGTSPTTSVEYARFSFSGLTIAANGFKPGGGVWAATSDRRTKKNIKALVSGTLGVTPWLDRTLKLAPVEFEYNGLAGTQAGTVYTGLIAQDVQKIFPAWIMESSNKIDDTPVLQIDSSPLIYALLECVRELKAEIDKLKSAALVVATVTAVSAPLSVNLAKVDRLLKMDATGLGSIGFTGTQIVTFTAGSTALRTGMTAGLPESELLRVLSTLLTSIGLTLSGVLAKL